METKGEEEQQQLPLLETYHQTPGAGAGAQPNKPTKTPAQKAVRKSFKGTAHLANLLPTGSVFAFQVLSPVLTHAGRCRTFVSQTQTLILLFLCAVSCFVLRFTDSFRDQSGKVRYGVATSRGMWVMDGGAPPENVEEYKIRFMDFVHGILSVMVFGAVALFDQNVVKCLNPRPSDEADELVSTARITVGVVCSIMFLVFPTKRHGIGFPLSRR